MTVCFRLQIIISIIMPLLHALNLARAVCFRLAKIKLECTAVSLFGMQYIRPRSFLCSICCFSNCISNYGHTLSIVLAHITSMANNCARTSGTCSPKFLLFVLHDYFYVPEFYFKSSKSHTYESLLNKHYKA